MEKQDFLYDFLILLQRLVAKQVKFQRLGNVKRVCAVDVAYKGNTGIAVAVCDGDEKEVHKVTGKVSFPYIPGLLFIREAPIMLKALEGTHPELLLVDGHGIAHPRRSGIATVLGVLLEVPTIGIAKSRLVGDIVEENGVKYLVIQGERVGVKQGKYYFSPGNLVTLEDVVQFSRSGYPELLREADKLSKEYRRELEP
ncbi:endonuclease V [Metallosphaera tengchongensis]|uniref:Endonuclease V n=1 Tax=Metallosphaera tengchongensis TaxID=1532350 RepID=A0A6N0NSD3_9CREN|nr:endonuclease V [Metallosphaera tengchongensis]QKQ99104.1 endonuclease V [Metallosphaera tengchongensis]